MEQGLSEQSVRLEQGLSELSEQDGRLEQRLSEQSTRMEQGFSELSARMDSFEAGMLEMRASIKELVRVTTRLQRIQFLHSWVLGVGVAALLIPQIGALVSTA